MRRRGIGIGCLPLLSAVLGCFLPSSALADIGGQPARLHALVGARVVTGPSSEPVLATILIRDGRVAMVGSGVEPPADAIRHDLTGRTIYAGWVEPYLLLEAPEGEDAAGSTGVVHANRRIRADFRAVDSLPLEEDRLRSLRQAGYAVAQVVPSSGIFRGRTAVIALGGGASSEQVLRVEHAQAFALKWARWDAQEYPGSLMGAVALTRQTLYDARWNREAWERWQREPGRAQRPPENASLRALRPLLAREMPWLMESGSWEMMPRVLELAREFAIHPIVVSRRSDHYRIIDRLAPMLADVHASLVVSLDLPTTPKWRDDDARVDVPLERLIDWERAPADLALLEMAGVDFAVTANGLESPSEVLERLRTAIAYGLSPRAALEAVTTRPAALLGVGHRVGTIESDKVANLLIATGELFETGTEIEAVWVDGVRYGDTPRRATKEDVVGEWDLARVDAPDSVVAVVKFQSAAGGWTGTHWAPETGTSEAETPEGASESEPERDALEDVSLVRGVLAFDRQGETYRLRKDGPFLRGERLSRDGVSVPVLARAPRPDADEPPEPVLSLAAAAWPPRYDEDDAPRTVLVRGATVWTSGPEGTIPDADLLVQGGTIIGVGSSLAVPNETLVIDGTGLHVTPGLLDGHSHSAISGGANECTESCTAEVRIADVVASNASVTYLQLAAGLTVENLLHGSCNTIGGQNAVIKLRWGSDAAGLLFAAAPAGIKFALGENVKRSGWDSEEARDRYPNTRMGVEQFIRDRFHAADDYRRRWDEWRTEGRGDLPRRDLELDALVEVLNGTRLVHCHSYRADEILMLIRVAEEFGFRVATFQHALEAYRVADEIAAHGAGVSCFSDWWNTKMETTNATPYAGEILWRRGVNVSFNSDNSELSRRLNLEAAKAVKYGGVPEDEALKFVTINPARQLGVEDHVGSLEVGKDADFVIWSAHPLSDFAVCQQTWIDGVKRFDRLDDLVARGAAADLRERLLEKADKASGSTSGSGGGSGAETESEAFLHSGHSDGELIRGICVGEAACCGE